MEGGTGEPTQAHGPATPARLLRVRTRWLGLGLAALLLMGAGTFTLHRALSAWSEGGKRGETPHAPEAATSGLKVVFGGFVVPFPENAAFTYISVSLSFPLPSRELREEMLRKQERIRGVIYGLLREEAEGKREMPSLDRVKALIIEGVNGILTGGRISDVYVTEFVAV